MEEDDEEVISVSGSSDSSQDFTCDESEDGDDDLCRSGSDESCEENVPARPVAHNQKSQNVDALLRYT